MSRPLAPPPNPAFFVDQAWGTHCPVDPVLAEALCLAPDSTKPHHWIEEGTDEDFMRNIIESDINFLLGWGFTGTSFRPRVLTRDTFDFAVNAPIEVRPINNLVRIMLDRVTGVRA